MLDKPERQKPDRETAMARLQRLLERAGSHGEEEVIVHTFRLERQGVISPEDARTMRFQAYGAIGRWQQGEASDPASASEPPARRKPSQRAVKPGSRHAQRLDAKERAREWRRTTRKLRADAAGDGADPLVESATKTIDELARLQDLHETQAEVDLLGSFWEMNPELDGLPPVLAHKLLLHSERLIDGHAPETLFQHLRDSGADAPGVEALLVRRDARQAMPPLRNTDLVSLGRNCLPWTLPNRWGLRRGEQVMTLDCPFNLAVHNFAATMEAITTNFDGYADPANMTRVETQSGHHIAYNRRYRSLWNHEKNAYWLDDDYANLRRHLERRVDNFRNAMQSGRKLAFVMSTDEFEAEEMQERAAELHDALRANSNASDLILLLFSHDPDAAPAVREAGSSVFHINRPMPSHNYIWSAESDYASSAGVAFEQAWVADLRAILTQRGFD